MGFKGLNSFNLALLSKMAWRLYRNPNTLWSSVIKGLHFPSGDFLTATKGSKASWLWSSILEGRDQMANNLVWRIGDGGHVQVWKDM